MAQLNKGTTYSAGNATVTIENLNALVDNATLLPGAISDQVALSGNAASSDQVLLLSSGSLKKAEISQLSSFSGGTTGLTPSTPTTGAVTLAGTLAVANGGTGSSTQQEAINTLAGAVTSGQFLRGNGTNVAMSAIQVADVPTLNQNTTGTAANVTGTVAVVNGGTGVNTLTGYVKGIGTASLTALASIPVADISGTLPVAKGGTGKNTATTASLLSVVGTTFHTDTATLQLTSSDGFVVIIAPSSSSANTVYLPDASSTADGTSFLIANYKSISVNVRIFGGITTYATLAAGKQAIFTLYGSTNVNTSWTNSI